MHTAARQITRALIDQADEIVRTQGNVIVERDTMTPDEAANIFNTAHPDDEREPCSTVDHQWSDWGFNQDGSAEYRLCAACGDMEQQWIAT